MKCKVENCDKVQRSKGYCNTHYAKIRRTGTLERIKGTPAYNKHQSEVHLSELSKLDSTPDPKHRGFLAVNIVNDIKFKALKRGKIWNLTNIEAYKLIIEACHYCGFKPDWPHNRGGIDRVNNEIGYELSNCVPCCFTCNSAKKELTITQFFDWIKRIYKHSIESDK